MTTKEKEAVHALIDQLPDEEFAIVEAFVHFIASRSAQDKFLAFLRAAPDDDEPTTPQEDESADRAWREYQQGDVRSAAEARRHLLAEHEA